MAEDARLEAEQASRAKSSFLTTMSHELRTPLQRGGGLRGPAPDGRARGDHACAADDLERIKRSGQYLLGLINDVLNFAKLDAGQVEFRLDAVPASQLLEGLEDLIRPQMNDKGLVYHHGECERGGDGARRSGEGAADPAEPAHECGEVHGAGWRDLVVV